MLRGDQKQKLTSPQKSEGDKLRSMGEMKWMGEKRRVQTTETDGEEEI